MTLWNYQEIKNQILENWEQLTDTNYPEDILEQLADSACPVYQHDIIKEWQEMPHEYDNRWQDSGIADKDLAQTKITELMNIDLYYYYRDQFDTGYREILEAEKELESEKENA